MATPTERLPWLDDAPAGGSPTAQKRPGGVMWPWYLLLLLLIAVVGAGAWWLSTGKDAAPPVLPTEEGLPIPVAVQEQATSEQLPPVPGIDDAAASAEAAPPVTRAERRPEARRSERRIQQPAERPLSTGSPTRGIFPADEPGELSLSTSRPAPVVVTNPDPNRGRVIQLGAFPTRAQAEESWKRITRRYPYLTTRAKMVNTVDVRGLGGGRPTRMYRLQLGTSSQAQSVVICQQLERAGHSCVVVY